MNARGFTLVELMIVVAIIGILAGVGIPQYNDFVVESKLKEAHSALMDARTRQEQRYQDDRQYSCPANFTTQNFTISCVTSNAAQGYTLTAAGNASSGVDSFTFTINESNVRASTKGSINNNACWSTKASGAC